MNRDFMTMRKIGLMQEFTNGAKRRAEAEAALATGLGAVWRAFSECLSASR